MPDNTVTLAMDGLVKLNEFSKGITAFNELLNALSDEVAGGALGWVLDDLQYSSAIATAKADGPVDSVSSVVLAYAEVGRSLEARRPIGFGEPVRNAATKIIDIGVERVRFETAHGDALVVKDIPSVSLFAPVITIPSLQLVRGRKAAFGGLKGRIQTLTTRNGLRFTLYDVHQDKAVSCYFEEGKQDLVRDLWGTMAIVEGMISRDPSNGRPLSIRGVTSITPVPEPSATFEYEAAMGSSRSRSGMSAADAIRRVRDAE